MNTKLPEYTLLVVDDIPANLKLLVEILKTEYRISVATSGPDTLRIAQSSHPPDLILLDIMMPEMNGYEVCRRLKNNPSTADIPVIFLTAKSQEEDETAGFKIGAVDYITKPFNPAIVRSRIRTHLELKSQRTKLETRTQELNKALNDLDVRNRFIRQAFGLYLSEDIANTILESPEGLKLGGETRDVTLLMSDLRGFTSIGESFPAEDVVAIINIYLEVMTDIIFKYKGTIDEFIGDAILAIFGAPITGSNHAMDAVACALEMQIGMAEVNRLCQARGFPQLEQGIGINTGRVVVGNIGSKKRIKYGVVGRNVNLTARIQSYTLGGQIFLSDHTKKICGSLLQTGEKIEILAKGISSPASVYEVTGIGGDYQIYLPNKKTFEMIHISPPMPVHFYIIHNSEIINEIHEGKILKMNTRTVEIEAIRDFRPLTDIKLLFNTPETKTETETDAKTKTQIPYLYGKITRTISQAPPVFLVGFTSVPEPAQTLVKKITQS